jgi:hypothetical protein
MIRQLLPNGTDPQSDAIHHLNGKIRVENMLMQAAIFQVFFGTMFEVFVIPGGKVHFQVVQLQNLREMRQVAFANACLVVGDEVRQVSRRPAVIESSVGMRHNKDHNSVDLQHAHPFVQRLQRVGNMLDTVRAQQKVIAARCDSSKIGGLADILVTGGMTFIESEVHSFRSRAAPDGSVAEVAVIEPSDDGIDGKQSTVEKNAAGASDFQADFLAEKPLTIQSALGIGPKAFIAYRTPYLAGKSPTGKWSMQTATQKTPNHEPKLLRDCPKTPFSSVSGFYQSRGKETRAVYTAMGGGDGGESIRLAQLPCAEYNMER